MVLCKTHWCRKILSSTVEEDAVSVAWHRESAQEMESDGMDACMGGWMYEWMGEQVGERNARKDGWWMGGWVEGIQGMKVQLNR